jgi:hypothetical protein
LTLRTLSLTRIKCKEQRYERVLVQFERMKPIMISDRSTKKARHSLRAGQWELEHFALSLEAVPNAVELKL